ncbi:DUF664 domain-containing protein [Streptomyces sp. NPDC057445]|uniref:mycothiol transferase n=1 Tax=Streptomyces sp. NPDC057445 TaxID=3346136 RepID=UPI00369FB239
MTATTTPRPTLDAERADLLAALAAARSALTNTTRELSDEQAGEQPTVSALCLGGLIKHVASIEDGWMRFVVEGPSAMRYDLPDGVTWADLTAGTAREFPQSALFFAGLVLTALVTSITSVVLMATLRIDSYPDALLFGLIVGAGVVCALSVVRRVSFGRRSVGECVEACSR